MARTQKFKGAAMRRLVETAKREGSRAAAKAFGVSVVTVRRYVAQADAAAGPAPLQFDAKAPLGLAQPTLKSTVAGGDPYPFAAPDDEERADTADAAHRGSNGASQPEPEQAGTSAAPAPDHVPLTGEALVDLSEMAVAMAGHVALAHAGLEGDLETAKLLEFSERERAKLLVTAPYAAQYLDQFISNAPLVAAITFGVSLAIVGAGKIMAVRALARERAPKADRKPPRFVMNDPLTAEMFDKPT